MNLSKSGFFKSGALCGLLLFILLQCGCQFAMPEVRESGKSRSKNFTASYNQIRLRARSLVGPMCGEIEHAADHIILTTTNVAVQRAALLWKIEGVPAMRAALFQPDPLTALFDSWVFCQQMRDYFETGPGKAALGQASGVAVNACQRMADEVSQVAASMTSPAVVAKYQAFSRQWAADHPIRYSIASRETTLSRALERGGLTSFSAGQAVAQTAIAVDDLSRRLEVYSDQLVRQGRWETELLKSDLIAEFPVREIIPLAERALQSADKAVTNVDRLVPSIERVVSVAETAPKLIETERRAAVEAVHEELKHTTEFVEKERIAALEQLTRERVAAVKDLQGMITNEHRALVQDFGQITLKMTDHLFWRAIQLVATLSALFFFWWILLGRVRKRV